MREIDIINEREFMKSPTREHVLALVGEGRLGEARTHLSERIAALAPEDADNLLECRNLQAVVERAARNYFEALRIHNETYGLADASPYHVLRGRFHVGYGVTCEEIARHEGLPGYLSKALYEHEQAALHFQLAGDIDGAGIAQNNLAMVLCALGRTAEAHERLAEARVYFSGNTVKLAQVDETEARVYLKENSPSEALFLVSGAIRAFIRHGEKRLLGEAIRTQMKAGADCLSQSPVD